MRNTLLFIGFLLLQNHLFAQCDPSFFAQFGQPNQAEKGEAILETTSGALFLAGSSGDHAQPFLMKINAHGDILWTKKFDTPDASLFGQLLELSDGNLLASTFPLSPPLVSFLIKLTPNGDIIWVKSFKNATLLKGDLAKTTDGGFVAATNEQPNSLFFSVYKYSDNGDLIWKKAFNTTGNTSLIAEIKATANGNFILAGYTNGGAAGVYDQMVVRLDNNGNILWQKNYASNEPDVLYSCDELPDGNLIFSGSTRAISGNSDGIILKTDAIGNILWQRIFSTTDIDFIYCFSQEITPDGILLTGMDRSQNGLKKRLFSIKFDQNGQFLAGNQYFDPTRNAYFRHVLALKNGQFLFSGTTDEAPNSTLTDAILMRTDSIGFLGNCQNTPHQEIVVDGNLTQKTGILTTKIPSESAEETVFSENILFEKVEICVLVCDTICTISEEGIQFPNVFTPNGDDLNEYFSFFDAHKCVEIIEEFNIFNRWGNRIFFRQKISPADFGDGWNGQIDGQLAPMEVYIFSCKLKLASGVYFSKSGDFTLAR